MEIQIKDGDKMAVLNTMNLKLCIHSFPFIRLVKVKVVLLRTNRCRWRMEIHSFHSFIRSFV
jgi:hypothetical protein